MVAIQHEIEEEIKWPFCSKTVINELKIKIISLLDKFLVLENNERISFNDAINEISSTL